MSHIIEISMDLVNLGQFDHINQIIRATTYQKRDLWTYTDPSRSRDLTAPNRWDSLLKLSCWLTIHSVFKALVPNKPKS